MDYSEQFSVNRCVACEVLFYLMHEKCQFPFEISSNSPILDISSVLSIV